jgi:hypothetical protein
LSRLRRVGLVVSGLIGLAALLVAARSPVDRLERRLYDRYLGLSGASACPADFLVLEPDGKGTEAWSEGEAAAVLRLLGEFGAKRAALSDPGFGRGAGREELAARRSELPLLVDREYGTIERNVRGLFEALRSGTLPPKEFGKSIDLLTEAIKASGERVKAAAVDDEASVPSSDGASPGVVTGSFVGSRADFDGVLRSVVLVKEEGGRLMPSYELSSLVDYLGSPSLEKAQGRLVLRGCSFPGGSVRDISLPIDGGGRFRLGWPRASSAPRVLHVGEIRSAIREENALVVAVEELNGRGALGAEGGVLLSRYRRAELLRSGLSGAASADSAAAVADWREARAAFFAAALAYFRAEGAAAEPAVPVAGPVDASAAVPVPPSAAEDSAAASSVADTGALRAECYRLALSLDARRKTLSEALGGAYVFIAPRGDGSALATVSGGATNAAEAGAAFAALVLSGRYPVAGPLAFRVALVLLLTLLALAAASLAVFRGGGGRRPEEGAISKG